MNVPERVETIRFSVLNRLLHLFVMVGFAGLALTGFSLKFSAEAWAQAVAWLLGGAPGLRCLHRIFAVLTYGCVLVHLFWLVYYKSVIKGRLTGKDTMFPGLRDFKEMASHMAYMFGRRPAPSFEKFSYWEKFDYWAILLGMNTMGLTGLVIWYPGFFTGFIPGYLVNVAQVLHLYEAILAVSLKFVVHIITTHLRPEVFPLDKSIFNGRGRHSRVKTTIVALVSLGCLWCMSIEASAQRPALMSLMDEGVLRPCLDCHRLPNVNTNEGAMSSKAFCLECHSNKSCTREDGTSLFIAMESFGKGRHGHEACIACHVDVAKAPHKSASGAACTSCHYIHDYSQSGDPHIRVQCQACHRKSPFVELDRKRDLVVLARKDKNGVAISLADHGLGEAGSRETCKRCHAPGTSVAAAASILPGKNLLCIPCHGASAAPGHWSFFAAMLILIAGFTGAAVVWLKGRVGEESDSVHRKISIIGEELWGAIFSKRFFRLLSLFFFDVLLQRRLLKERVLRWFAHSLVYYGFLGKFSLALISVIFRSFSPKGVIAYALLDKNNWINALLNDIFGVLILLGIIVAALQRLAWKPAHVLSEVQDSLALIIIGFVAAGGFVLEGARILVTELPAEKAAYSFAGRAAAFILKAVADDWRGTYGILWWTHAAAWSVFLAYVPFGKLKHIILTPVSLLLREGARTEAK